MVQPSSLVGVKRNKFWLVTRDNWALRIPDTRQPNSIISPIVKLAPTVIPDKMDNPENQMFPINNSIKHYHKVCTPCTFAIKKDDIPFPTKNLLTAGKEVLEKELICLLSIQRLKSSNQTIKP